MRIVEQTPDRLILHDSPWGMRAFAVLFTGGGGGMLALMIAGNHLHEHNAWVGVVVSSAFAITGIGGLVAAADRRIILDRPSKILRTVRRGLFGSATQEYPFSSIRDIALEESSVPGSAATNPICRIVILLRDGTPVPCSPVLTADIGNQSRCVAAARTFGGWDSGSADLASPGATPAGSDARHAAFAADISTEGAAAKPPQNLALMGCFLVLFALIGVTMLSLQVERLLLWRPVSAVVLSSQLETVREKNAVSYRPVVSYQYVIDGRPYQSSNVSIFAEARGLGWATRVSESYRPGAAVTAYVDPGNPTHAFLLHRLSMIPFLVIGFPLAIGAIFFGSARWVARQSAAAVATRVPVLSAPTVGPPTA